MRERLFTATNDASRQYKGIVPTGIHIGCEANHRPQSLVAWPAGTGNHQTRRLLPWSDQKALVIGDRSSGTGNSCSGPVYSELRER